MPKLTKKIQDAAAAMVRRQFPPKSWPVFFTMAMSAMVLPGGQMPQAWATDVSAGAVAEAPTSQEKLDSLLAPVALYPDDLLTQVLIASTYPLDVVAAARFVKENRDLKGSALDAAVSDKNWDPSVQSLTAFPQTLEMMNDKLDWTQELGDAFLEDEQRVMQTVQNLRQRADQAGNLQSNSQQTIVREQTTIIIEPARTEVVYVPTYDPTVIYGHWWAPHYPPYYWRPPSYYYPPGGLFMAGLIGFGIAMAINDNHWGWCRPHWRGGSINININKNNVFIKRNAQFRDRVSGGNWRHNPSQRKGVAYRDTRTREKYRKVDANAVSARRDARGFEPPTTRDRDRPSPGGPSGTRDIQKPAEGRDRDRPPPSGPSGTRDIPKPAEGRDRLRPGGTSGTRDIQRPEISRDRPQPEVKPAARDVQPSRGASFDRGSDTRPSFDAGQSRRQAERASNRGSTSRASMRGSRGSAGGNTRHR